MRCSSAKTRLAWFASLTLATLLLSGCLFPSEAPTRYFLLDYGSVEDNSTDEGREPDPLFDAPVVVEDAFVAPLYDRRQIVQRPEAPEIRLLTRDLWVVGPSEAVSEALFDRFRSEGIFPEVLRSSRNAPDPYLVQARVHELEYRCCAATPRAVFEIEFLFLNPRGTVLTRTRSVSEDEISDSVTEFVLTINARLTEAIDNFISEVRAAAP